MEFHHFVNAHLDYLEGLRDQPPSVEDLPELHRKCGRRWLRSITDARALGLVPDGPSLKQLIERFDSIGED